MEGPQPVCTFWGPGLMRCPPPAPAMMRTQPRERKFSPCLQALRASSWEVFVCSHQNHQCRHSSLGQAGRAQSRSSLSSLDPDWGGAVHREGGRGPLLPLEPGEHLMGSEALRAAERDPASQRRTPPSVGRAASLPRLTRRGPHLASDWKPPEGLVNNADPRVPAPTPRTEDSVGESQMLAWNWLPGRSWARSVGTRARVRGGHVRAVEVLIHSFTHSLTHSSDHSSRTHWGQSSG